ncbi:hypothetical protein [Acidocella sp.]|uniref:hypothetical protein n=1 Tax=Acidocella sp. TaxID=50710 RepID=UPI003CFD314D
MLKSVLYRLRQFLAADVTAALDRLQAELQATRAENTALRRELAAREEKENALAKQMEAALLTIALNHREAAQSS